MIVFTLNFVRTSFACTDMRRLSYGQKRIENAEPFALSRKGYYDLLSILNSEFIASRMPCIRMLFH